MKNVFQLSMAYICSGTLLLSSCAKERVAPQPATPLSSFSHQNRTVEELIQAASPELYADLLEQAQNNRAPIIKILPGSFRHWDPKGGCIPKGTACGVQIIDDRSGNSEIESVPADIWTLAQDISSSNGSDQMIFNAPNPTVIEVRAITDISVSATGEINFTVVQ